MVIVFFANAEKNYLNTEHEALAVVWTLVKFRQEIDVPAKSQ